MLSHGGLEHVFQTGEGASYESVGAGAEGSMSDYVTAVGPVIVDGEIIAATLISRDITDRKRAEEKLRGERNQIPEPISGFLGWNSGSVTERSVPSSEPSLL